MQAIVLSGGFGTRLSTVVADRPKPMADVNGRPFLEILLDDLAKNNFKKVVLAVGYMHEYIVNHFKDNYQGMEIVYAIEQEPLGTGGAVLNAMQYITDEYAFIINGDTLFKIDYKELIADDLLVMAIAYLEKNERYGQVEVDRGYVTRFKEKETINSGYINGGIYRMNKKYLESLNLPKRFSFEKDVLEKQVYQKPIKAVYFEAYFIDMGVPEDYLKLQEDLKR